MRSSDGEWTIEVNCPVDMLSESLSIPEPRGAVGMEPRWLTQVAAEFDQEKKNNAGRDRIEN